MVFNFVTQKEIRLKYFDLSEAQSATLRAKLPIGVYWIRPSGRLILWNLPLLQSFLLTGDCPHHRQLVEDFLASLPQSA